MLCLQDINNQIVKERQTKITRDRFIDPKE